MFPAFRRPGRKIAAFGNGAFHCTKHRRAGQTFACVATGIRKAAGADVHLYIIGHRS
jgi:hypothetical protein